MGLTNQKRLLCFGEISWDRLWVLNRMPQGQGDCHVQSELEGPGGCALNSACTLAGFGLPVSLGGNFIGEDTAGARIEKYLANLGIETRLQKRLNPATPVCQVLVEAKSGRRDFILSHAGIHDFGPELIGGYADEVAEGRFSHVFLQCYSETLAREFLKRLHEKTGGLPAPAWLMTQDLAACSEFVPEFDAIQISQPEHEPWDKAHAQALALPYFQGRVSQVFITAGPRGVALCERGKSARLFPALTPAQVIDTTGCGDAFRSGLMAGLYQGQALESAITLGSQWGARKAERLGSHFVDHARS